MTSTIASSVALIGRSIKIIGSPRETTSARRRFSSNIGPTTKPSSRGAAVYASAMETSYELKSSGTSAGLSVAGVGSVSMPWAADKDTLVKTGEVTVTAPEFYQRLFELIRTLDG